MNKFQELFDLAIKYGYTSKSRNLNGLESWNYIKNKLDSTKICEWAITRMFPDGERVYDNNIVYSKIHNELKMYGEDGDEEKYKLSHNNWERAHCVLQTARIPKKSDCSIQKIVQIGFNIGQYKAENKEKAYNKKVNKFIELNKLNKVKSYVNLDTCTPSYEILDGYVELIKDKIEYLPKAQKGGVGVIANELDEVEYYEKYLKYKLKYMSLRNKK
jgi:hypothetical protein